MKRKCLSIVFLNSLAVCWKKTRAWSLRTVIWMQWPIRTKLVSAENRFLFMHNNKEKCFISCLKQFLWVKSVGRNCRLHAFVEWNLLTFLCLFNQMLSSWSGKLNGMTGSMVEMSKLCDGKRPCSTRESSERPKIWRVSKGRSDDQKLE